MPHPKITWVKGEVTAWDEKTGKVSVRSKDATRVCDVFSPGFSELKKEPRERGNQIIQNDTVCFFPLD